MKTQKKKDTGLLLCREIGRQIESSLFKIKPISGHLPVEKLDEIFKSIVPIIDSNNASENKQKKVSFAMPTDNYANIRSAITSRRSRAIVNNQEIILSCMPKATQGGDISITHVPATKDIETCDGFNLLLYQVEDPFWDNYCPKTIITMPPDKVHFLGATIQYVINHIVDNKLSINKTADLLDYLHNHNIALYNLTTGIAAKILGIFRENTCQYTPKNKRITCGKPSKSSQFCSRHRRFQPY